MGGVYIHLVMWISMFGIISSTYSFNTNSLLSTKLISQTVSVSENLTTSITNGIQFAINHCQKVFKWDKWNCPESAFSWRRYRSSTKEQAIAHAITAAGLVHTITRNCSRGQLNGCGCNRKLYHPAPYITKNGINLSPKGSGERKSNSWSWGGCSDDVEYGMSVSKAVLDSREQGSDIQAFVNLHNNLVGRTMVRNSMVKKCRCHGISGSCSIQTCWMQVAPFIKIANILRQRYKKAVRISVENRVNKFITDSSSTEFSDRKRFQVNSHQLVFFENSPDYCVANNTTGWPGTKGRACSRSMVETASPREKRSCRNLCRSCGYRVRKHKRQVQWNCNCSFKWCCEVHCNICSKTVEEFFCV